MQIRTFHVQASSSGRLSVGMCLAWDPESQVRYLPVRVFTATLFAVVRYNTMELGIYTVPKAKGIHEIYIWSELRAWMSYRYRTYSKLSVHTKYFDYFILFLLVHYFWNLDFFQCIEDYSIGKFIFVQCSAHTVPRTYSPNSLI